MKILIADDEKIARTTLKSMLSDLNLAMTVYEASDGEMFLQKVKEHYPQIAFVDIKMPKLDGLNAIKEAKVISPHTKWVILTGYSEFDFAREAVELQVVKYLLKPLNPRKLAETMVSVLVDYRQDIIKDNTQFKRNIINLYYNQNSAGSLSQAPFIDNVVFQTGIIYLDGYEQNNRVQRKNELFRKVKTLAEKHLDNNVRIALFNIKEEKIATVCAYSMNNDPGSKEKVDAYFKAAKTLLRQLVSPSLSANLIKSDIFNNMEDDLIPQINKVEEFSPLRVLLGKDTDYCVPVLQKDETLVKLLPVCQSLLSLCDFFNQQKFLYYQDNVKYLINELNVERVLMNKQFMENITDFLRSKANIRIEAGLSIQNWLEALINYEDNPLLQEKKVSCRIEEVLAYVEENYMNDIGINTIAQVLNLSPNYLSSFFYKKTQKRFTDYLTEVRIAKAKELLRETDLYIKDIAPRVGYYSTRHFTKLFVKYVNCYPSEYSKKFKK